MPPRMSLRLKLQLVVLVVLLPIFGSLLLDARADYERHQELVLNQQASMAESVAALVEAVLDDGINVGWALADDPAVRSFDPTVADPHLQRLAVRYPQYFDIEVYNGSGESVGTSVPYGPGESRAAEDELTHLRQAVATGRPAVSDVHPAARFGGQPAVDVAVPVLENGRATGVVELHLDLAQFPSLLANVRLPPDSTIIATDPRGRIAFHSMFPDLGWEARDLAQLPEVQAALAGQMVQTADFRGPFSGDTQVLSLVPGSSHGWLVGVSSPTAAIFAPIDAEYRAALARFSLIAIAGIAVASWLSASLLGPLRLLAAHARDLGRGQFSRAFDVRTGDEVEDVGRAFNFMAEELHDTMRHVARARSEAEAAWARLQGVIDQMPEGVMLADARGRMLVSNQEALTLSCGDTGQVDAFGNPVIFDVRLPSGEPAPWDDIPLVRAIKRQESPRGVELLLRRADGSLTPVLASAAPVRDPAGSVTAAVTVLQDISQRKQAEEQLEAERARLHTILENAPSGIIYVEAESGRVIVNPAARERIGRPLAPEAGRPQYVGQICQPDGEPLALEELPSSTALQGHATRSVELLIVRPDGRRIPILVNAAPVRDHDGRVTAAVVVYEDISSLKELERLREEWTTIIAHDLRQPVTVITGYAGILARLAQQHPAPAEEKTGTQHILSSAHQLNRMISDLLDVSRLEAGRLDLQRQRVDLPALVHQVVERTAEVTRGHPVRVSVLGDVPPVEADPGRIEQVLGNLLSNAAKYGYPEKEILVEVERHEGEVKMAVTNQGLGIAREDLPGVFDRFHRTRQAEAGPVGGLGLGLFLAKGLVEAHGGRIWVESTPGESTTFRFTLSPAGEHRT